MKKFLALLLATLMVLSLAACGGSASTSVSESTPESSEASEASPEGPDYSKMSLDELKAIYTTVTDGKLTVATSPDFAPYEFYALDEAGTPTLAGFDMGLAGYIADYLGLELEVIPMDFDGVLAELASGSVDIGLAGLSPDPERMDAMDFSDIYYMGGQSFVTVQSKKDLFPTLADANKAEYSIGAQTASIQYNLAMENTPDADIVMLTKVPDILAELMGDKLDGAFIETVVAESYAKNYPDLCVALEVPYDVAGSAVGVAKGNEALVAAINLAINAALEDGSMTAFIDEANTLAAGDKYEGLLENMTDEK